MHKYTVIIQRTSDLSYGAYVPDLPGCVSLGTSRKEVIKNIREAINLHLEGYKKEGLEIPESLTEAIIVMISK